MSALTSHLEIQIPKSIAFLTCLIVSCCLGVGIANAADACSPEFVAAVKAEANRPIDVRCNLQLKAGDVVRNRLILSGEAASGIEISCHGATIESGSSDPTILIMSQKNPDGSWSVPKNISISGCVVKGSIGIRGLSRAGGGAENKNSSMRPDHTKRAQAAAPSKITLSGLRLIASGETPLYAGPGTTDLEVRNSTFSGTTDGVAIYLDAESARNRIQNNRFELVSTRREMIALDGSAHNVISQNTFVAANRGAIFLYRNCGESGAIRHQSPQYNTISKNVFEASAPANPTVWIGSRQGKQSYCFIDPAHPYGSASSSLDHAQHNTVSDNTFRPFGPSSIVDAGADNRVENNR